MQEIKLYRKRFIPNECILLKDDHILHADEAVIVTSWNTIRPKKTLHHGLSCYFIEEGFKLSKFYKQNGDLLYWYFDIIEYEYNKETSTYVFTDLLADVIVYPDASYRIMDLDELSDAYEQNLIDARQMLLALRRLDHVLQYIYSDRLTELEAWIDRYE